MPIDSAIHPTCFNRDETVNTKTARAAHFVPVFLTGKLGARLGLMIIVSFVAGIVRADTRVSEDYGARTWQRRADGGLEYRFSFKLQGDNENNTRVIAQTGPTEHFKIIVPLR